MSEAAMWGYLRERVRASQIGMERITEKLNPGVPDLVYCFPDAVSGWLELKFILAVANPDAVRIPWKTADQPFWLQRWVRWGGRSGVLLRVPDRGWFYWRPSADIKWVAWVQGPVPLSSATWCCGLRLDLPGLLAALH